MTSKEEYKNRLKAKIDAAAVSADQLCKDDYEVLIAMTHQNLEELIPNVGERGKYEKLITSVQESSNHNENLAQLQVRLESLGANGISLAKQLVKLIT